MKWKLTPAEPTPEMLSHGEYAADACYREDPCGKGAEHIYKDMLSAAPDPLEDAELVDRGARAIYDAIDPTSGDPIANTLHMSEYIDGSVPLLQQLEQVMEICRSASRAFITAMKGE